MSEELGRTTTKSDFVTESIEKLMRETGYSRQVVVERLMSGFGRDLENAENRFEKAWVRFGRSELEIQYELACGRSVPTDAGKAAEEVAEDAAADVLACRQVVEEMKRKAT